MKYLVFIAMFLFSPTLSQAANVSQSAQTEISVMKKNPRKVKRDLRKKKRGMDYGKLYLIGLFPAYFIINALGITAGLIISVIMFVGIFFLIRKLKN